MKNPLKVIEYMIPLMTASMFLDMLYLRKKVCGIGRIPQKRQIQVHFSYIFLYNFNFDQRKNNETKLIEELEGENQESRESINNSSSFEETDPRKFKNLNQL